MNDSSAVKVLREGKVPWELVARWVTGALAGGDASYEVLLGPGRGEDAALIRVSGVTLAVASDPVTFASHEAGRLCVMVNANDVAATGADPWLFLPVVLLPPSSRVDDLDELLKELVEQCAQLGVVPVGGHTEVTPGLPRPIVAGTMLGKVVKPLPTSGAKPGNIIGITKWVGLEGTRILISEYGARLGLQLPEEASSDDSLMVVEDARVARSVDGVTALHDVTEGGVGEALYELAAASGTKVIVDRAKLPVLDATLHVCSALGLDPAGLIGSGALLVAAAPEAKSRLEEAFSNAGIPFAWIGRVEEGPPKLLGLRRFPADEITKVFLLDKVEAFLFDLDGTVVKSPYDWDKVREELGVGSGSILDQIESMEPHERARAEAKLVEIEEKAARGTLPDPSALGLLELLRDLGVKTALVTNNTSGVTERLLARFGLSFDVVVTRTSCGSWKPSPTPLLTACERLGVEPAHTAAVGDSVLDVEAAVSAGCGVICGIGTRLRDDGRCHLWFETLAGLLQFVRVVLDPSARTSRGGK